MARMSSTDRRSELVQAALRVIAANGVAAATTRAIVAEAGMSLASFHYAFTSRDAMMRELIASVVENETAAAVESIPAGGDIRSIIEEAMRAYLKLLIDNPGHEQVMFELMHYAVRTPGLEDLATEQYARYRAAASELLEGVATITGVSWSLPIDDIARIVVTFTDGLSLAWLADRDAAAAERVIGFAADSLCLLAVPATQTSDSEHPAR
jgi:AcrR family transcriptional regulator